MMNRLGARILSHNKGGKDGQNSYVAAGGLAGYGGNITESYRLTGVYTAARSQLKARLRTLQITRRFLKLFVAP
jgi:hypothetical protein